MASPGVTVIQRTAEFAPPRTPLQELLPAEFSLILVRQSLQKPQRGSLEPVGVQSARAPSQCSLQFTQRTTYGIASSRS